MNVIPVRTDRGSMKARPSSAPLASRAWAGRLLWSFLGCACIMYIVIMAHYYESHAHSHLLLTTSDDKHAAWDGSHLLSKSWLRLRHSPNITRPGAAPAIAIEEPLKPLNMSTLGSYLLPASGLVSEALLTRLVLSTYNVSLAYAYNHSNVLAKAQANTLLTRHANGEAIVSTTIPTHLPLLARRSTLFLITPTYPGRAPRRNFLRRHIASLKIALDESPMFWKPQPLHMSAAQILWIVVDDAPDPDASLASMLTCADLPFLYFPYGPTGTWGNAQRNAALMVVRALGRLGMMGPGYFMDDDSYISPWLFEPMFQVQRALLWPIANIGEGGWEGPVLDEDSGEILRWHAGWLERKFPVDMNAFCFHTSYLLDEAYFVMPLLFDFRGRGGESEFLQKLLDHKEEFEILCQECRFVWYNRPLDERDLLWPVDCGAHLPEHIKHVPSDLLGTRSVLYGKEVARTSGVQFDFDVAREEAGGGRGAGVLQHKRALQHSWGGEGEEQHAP